MWYLLAVGNHFLMFRVAILASTSGTDLQALIDERAAGKLPGIELSCLCTNVADCGAVDKAKRAGIPVHFIDPLVQPREAFDRATMAVLEPYKIDLIVLIGYMRILGPEFVASYPNRILNVHPSLLPKFAGGMNLDVHQAVLAAGEKETGMTIHLVTNELDAGPIVCQKSIPVATSDTAASLKAKVQVLEKKWYPEVIRWFATGRIKIQK